MSYFLRRLRSHAEAEDLTQEVFLRLAKANATELQAVEGYVFTIAANLLRDRSRRLKVRADNAFAVRAMEGEGIDPIDPAQIAADREALSALVRGLDELPEPTRSIFILYRLENADRRAIAEAFSLSRQQFDRQLAKAIAHLSAYMKVAE